MILLLHEGQPHNWHDLARAWSFEPLVVIALTLTAVVFAMGWWRLSREAGKHGSRRIWEVFCFAGGWLALFIALVSPLHAWGSVLFSAHMSQHEVLMLVAAPLLVLGRPLVVFVLGFTGYRWRRHRHPAEITAHMRGVRRF
jgi:cytochrome c oxidase assembly factor CtaG